MKWRLGVPPSGGSGFGVPASAGSANAPPKDETPNRETANRLFWKSSTPGSSTIRLRSGSDFLIPRFGIVKARKLNVPDSPGEGTRPTGIPVLVGPVPSPGVSLIFREIRKSKAVT